MSNRGPKGPGAWDAKGSWIYSTEAPCAINAVPVSQPDFTNTATIECVLDPITQKVSLNVVGAPTPPIYSLVFTGDGNPGTIAGAITGNLYFDTAGGNVWQLQLVASVNTWIQVGTIEGGESDLFSILGVGNNATPGQIDGITFAGINGASSPTAPVGVSSQDVAATVTANNTAPDGFGYATAQSVALQANPSSDASSMQYSAQIGEVLIPTGNSEPFNSAYGSTFSVDHWGTGEVGGGLYGAAFYATSHAPATVSNVTGTFTQAYQLGNGTVDEIDGLFSEVGNASSGGTVTTVAAGKFVIDNDQESGPGGTTTNTYGVWITSPGSTPGPETHLHGLHIDDQTVGGSNNQDPWGIVEENPTEKNALGSINIGGQNGPLICTGTGSPNGVVTAKVGSIYLRQDGGAGSTLYVKESGSGNSGWTAK